MIIIIAIINFIIIEFQFQLCDNRIIDGYTDNNMMIKWERQSTISAKIISDEVIIRAIDNVGWNIIFDIEPPKVSQLI